MTTWVILLMSRPLDEVDVHAANIVLDGNVRITGSIQHGEDLSCGSEGYGDAVVISGTGTGAQQTIAHGVKKCS